MNKGPKKETRLMANGTSIYKKIPDFKKTNIFN